MTGANDIPFWKRKALSELSAQEWESLCDHCGRCCLVKLQDEDSGEIHYTRVICALYDRANGGCMAYGTRHELMPDCLRLTPETVRDIPWLPRTCAYRCLAEGRDLPAWHPLMTGDPRSVRRAGVSVLGRVVSEREVREEDLPDYIHHWHEPEE